MKKQNSKNTKIKINPREVNVMNGEMYHHLVPITLNKRKGVLLVDTGASRTVFDSTRFENFKTKSKKANSPMPLAGAGGGAASQLSLLKNIKIDKLNLKNYLVAIVDLSHINGMFTSFKAEPIDGVLGSDFLRSHGACIDFKDNTLCLEFDEKEKTKKNNEYVKQVQKVMNV